MVNITPNVNFLTTLRNSGYNNYTAIADIIDNALDTNVNSKSVRVNINKSTKKESVYDSITIADDGCGMSYTTLVEALKLGAVTGKDKCNDLGSYGTGLKAASLSMGRKFTVKTKSKYGKFYVVEFDLDVLIELNTFSVDVREGNKKEYAAFKKLTCSNLGTVIELSKLDRITNKRLSSFKSRLSRQLSLVYRLFIDKGIKMYVNDDLIESFDPMFRNESLSEMLSEEREKFLYKDLTIEFTAFYIQKTNFKEDKVKRNSRSTGLYIYRNNRLVGEGLNLGIINTGSDGWTNGLKIELFVNGNSDDLFGSTFMKTIHEKDKADISQEFLKECKINMNCYIRDVVAKNRNKSIINKNESGRLFEDMNIIMKSINDNELVKADDIKLKQNISQESINESESLSNISNNKIISDWELISLGENGKLFRLNKIKGQYVLSINVNHVFYTEFLVDASFEVKSCLVKLYVAMGISLDSFYYDDEDVKYLILDEYLLEISSNLRKLIIN